jgi:hypothetical protein
VGAAVLRSTCFLLVDPAGRKAGFFGFNEQISRQSMLPDSETSPLELLFNA